MKRSASEVTRRVDGRQGRNGHCCLRTLWRDWRGHTGILALSGGDALAMRLVEMHYAIIACRGGVGYNMRNNCVWRRVSS